MRKIGLTKEFLEKQLELWKTKVSKRKKWSELVLSYEEKHKELKQRLDYIIKVFDEKDINNLETKFQDYAYKSKNRDNTFFDQFDNKGHIEKVFAADYFKKNIEVYKETYFYDKVKECYSAYIENMKNFNHDAKKSFDKVGNWKTGEDLKLKYNSGKSKGAMLQYLIIEYLAENLNSQVDIVDVR